jgi:hypothetical protein
MTPSTEPAVIGPGDWVIESDAPEIGRLELTLLAGGGVAGTHRAVDLTGSVEGRWSCDSGSARLALHLETAFGLRPSELDLDLALEAGDGPAVEAEDAGPGIRRRYRLRPAPSP